MTDLQPLICLVRPGIRYWSCDVTIDMGPVKIPIQFEGTYEVVPSAVHVLELLKKM